MSDFVRELRTQPWDAVHRFVRGSVEEVISDGVRDRGYRRKVLLLLGMALALDYADRAALGALGPTIKHAFHISNTGFGIVASAFSVVGALATLPAGILTDRARRTIVLAVAVGLWGLAMGLTGAATSFGVLVGARVFLGIVTATARPAILSISGDTFPTRVRGRALSLIGSGELVGDGIGFIVAGAIAAVLSWRGVFWLLGAAGFTLVYLFWRLPEPPRGSLEETTAGDQRGPAQKAVEEAAEIQPDERLVLRGDQTRRSLLDAVRYVLRVRTQVLVIVAGAIGSFFFAGLRTFIVVFAVKDYGVSRTTADLALLVAGIGGIAGVLAGGRVGDALIERGLIDGRIRVGFYGYLGTVAVLIPAFLLHSLWLALPLYVLGAACLAAPIPALDAVRLDVIHPQLWGRAEAIRTILLVVAEAAAPVSFGLVADHISGGGEAGLREAFLLALGSLLASGLILQLARRYYPRELAAAAVSRRDLRRPRRRRSPARSAA